MRPVFSVQFQVAPSVAAPGGSDVFDQVVRRLEDWVAGWYAHWHGLTVSPPLLGTSAPVADHVIEVDDRRPREGVRLYALGWSYPAPSDAGLIWNVSSTIAQSNGRTEVGLVIRIGSREYTVSPPDFEFRPPRIVRTLLEDFHCTIGGRAVRAAPTALGAADIDLFAETLRSPARRLPVVLFSREPYFDKCLASPTKVAAMLAGLGEVVVMDDKWASFRLTAAVGKPQSCFNGAVRIYWPGVSESGEVRADRPLLPEEVQQMGDAVGERLLRRLTQVAAFRFVEMPTTREAREATDAQRAEQLRANSGDLDWLLKQNEDLLSARKNADLARDDAQMRVLELEEEVQALRDNLRAMTEYAGDQAPAQEPVQDVRPETVREALDAAEAEFADALAVWPSAQRSADDCDFARPREVYEALMAVADVAKKYFAARAAGRSIGHWADIFEKMGFKYAATESQTTMTKYGQERDFKSDDGTRRIEKHLTLGGGDKKNCMQVYFDVQEEPPRFVIAHCGRHLPTDKYH